MTTPQLSAVQTVVQYISHSAVARCPRHSEASVLCGAALLLYSGSFADHSSGKWTIPIWIKLVCIFHVYKSYVDTIHLAWLSRVQMVWRTCWNLAWQAACAGMHVINNTLSYSIAHTHTHNQQCYTRHGLLFSLRPCPRTPLPCLLFSSFISQYFNRKTNLLSPTHLLNSFLCLCFVMRRLQYTVDGLRGKRSTWTRNTNAAQLV